MSAIGIIVSLSFVAERKLNQTWRSPADIVSAFFLPVNGKVLRQRNADKRLPPARLTEFVAALVIVDSLKLDDWVTISNNASKMALSYIANPKSSSAQLIC